MDCFNSFSSSYGENYRIMEVLGEGAFGNVRLGLDRNGKYVAMKFVRIATRNKIIPRAVFREIEALKQLNDCKYITSLKCVFSHETNICIVMEYMETDLANIISNTKCSLPVSHVKRYANMILEGIRFCHGSGIVHRDLKPSNIMINYLGQLKIGDFGLARVLPNIANHPEEAGKLSHQVATRWYRAPELLFASRSYGFGVDMWAFGVILMEMFTLQPLFPGTNDIDQIFRVLQVMGTPSDSHWPEGKLLPDYGKIIFPEMKALRLSLLYPTLAIEDINFIECFVKLSERERLSAAEALKHVYFYSTLPVMAQISELFKPNKRIIEDSTN